MQPVAIAHAKPIRTTTRPGVAEFTKWRRHRAIAATCNTTIFTSARRRSCPSRAATFDRKAKDRRTTQYFEMFGNRAIYHDGWVAATRHSIPWITTAQLPSFDKDRWELYHVVEDFSQADDLAAQHPQKLKELQDVFTKEAIRNNVFPALDVDERVLGDPGHSRVEGQRLSVPDEVRAAK